MSFGIQAQEITAEELLNKSIAYHDPEGNWKSFEGAFKVLMETPTRPDRLTTIELDFPNQYFKSTVAQDGVTTASELKQGDCTHWYEGETSFSKEIEEKHRLNFTRTTKMRNYYVYLYGLPMKLKDKGTILDSKVYERKLKGVSFWCIKATYEQAVGQDTWYFYFDKKTAQLRHYQFYHDESKNDGEYILLSEEAIVNGIKMPKKRAWYTNQENRYLGTDILVN